MRRRSFAAFFALAVLAGCAAGRDDRPGQAAGFVSRIMVVTSSTGQVSTMRFEPDGRVRARFGGREAIGAWTLENRSLCFTWSGSFRECWPWAEDLRPGQSRAITSDRGNQVDVRLQ